MLKKMFYAMGRFWIIFLIATLLLTIIHYFHLVNSSVISVLKFLIPIFSVFMASFWLGTQSEKKGYMEGLKLGLMIVFGFMILILLLDKFTWKSLLYYLILLLVSVLSSMIGINRKKKE